MANRYFNKQTTNARQALAKGGSAQPNPRRKVQEKGPKTGRPSRPSIPEFPRQPSPDPKGGPRKLKTKNFDNTDGTNRKKIISDKIRRNKIKDRLDKLKEKMKAGPIGVGLNPDKLKKSIKNLKDQMGGKGK